ncbi:unnamed protein product [Rhizophagus irregularis]|nr:unnamed protein product [Rhizophagus irregularis]
MMSRNTKRYLKRPKIRRNYILLTINDHMNDMARLVYYMGDVLQLTSSKLSHQRYKCQKLEFFTSLKIPGTKNDITSMQMTVNNKTKIMDFK